jgi:hypothetical protein
MREKVEKRELTKDELHIFLILEKEVNIDGFFQYLMNKTGGGWVLKAIEKRFEAHEIAVDKKTMIAVLSIGNGAVGKCAKYIDDIAQWCNERKKNTIDWDIFCKQIYPDGIPIL